MTSTFLGREGLGIVLVASLLLASCAPAAAPAPAAQAPAPRQPSAPQQAPAAAPANPAPAATAAAPSSRPTPAPAAAQPAAQAAASSAPKRGGVLRIATGADPENFDFYQTEGSTTLVLVTPAYNNLVANDPAKPTALMGDLAEKWEVSPDGKVFTFRLRSGVKWHDGKPFTADDVVYTLNLQKSPPEGYIASRKDTFKPVTKIEKVDDLTVRLTFSQLDVTFLPRFAVEWFGIQPKHILEAKKNMKTTVLGTGPFKFKSFEPGSHMELVRNPDYFVQGQPYLDGLTFFIIKDQSTAVAALRTSKVDFANSSRRLTPSEAKTATQGNPNIEIVKQARLGGPWFHLNATVKPFDDVRVRQAVSLAFNRQQAIDVVAEGAATVGTFVQPGGNWARPQADIEKLPGYRKDKAADLAKAKELVAAAKATGAEFAIEARDDVVTVSEYMQTQLQLIGLKATVKSSTRARTVEIQRAKQFAMNTSRNAYTDDDIVDVGRKWTKGAAQNYVNYYNPKLDELMKLQAEAVDPAKRFQLIQQVDDILIQDVPAILPYWEDQLLGKAKYVKGLAIGTNIYALNRYPTVWLDK